MILLSSSGLVYQSTVSSLARNQTIDDKRAALSDCIVAEQCFHNKLLEREANFITHLPPPLAPRQLPKARLLRAPSVPCRSSSRLVDRSTVSNLARNQTLETNLTRLSSTIDYGSIETGPLRPRELNVAPFERLRRA